MSKNVKNAAGKSDKYDALLLDNQLCFPFYVCAKEIVNRYTPFLNKIGLTYTQYITMMVMWEEKEVVSRHLKERLFLDSGTLTPVINKLAQKGLITKERSKEDQRDLIVKITDKGEALKEEAINVPARVAMCFGGDVNGAMELKRLLNEMMELFKNGCANNK